MGVVEISQRGGGNFDHPTFKKKMALMVEKPMLLVYQPLEPYFMRGSVKKKL
jgi:hypothetical protein